jgi:transcriptional regulator with XRE-family HTH domain
MFDIKVLATRLLLSRRDLGLDQLELAARSGVSNSYISDLERGRARNVGVDVVFSLADALGISTAYLLGISDDALGEGADRVQKEMSGDVLTVDVESQEQRKLLQEAVDALAALPPREQRTALDILRIMRKAEEETSAPLAPRIVGSE